MDEISLYTRDVFKLEIHAIQAKLELQIKLFRLRTRELEKLEFRAQTHHYIIVDPRASNPRVSNPRASNPRAAVQSNARGLFRTLPLKCNAVYSVIVSTDSTWLFWLFHF